MSKSTEVALFGDKQAELPAHVSEDKGLGNENVGQNDVTIPRLDVLQALSAAIETVPGAKAGLLMNTITHELYESVYVVNLHYKTVYSVFKKRTLGGGFEGMHETYEAAISHLLESQLINQKTADKALETRSKVVGDYDVGETARHVCLLLDENGTPKQPVVLLMSGTKLGVSKNWNSDINIRGGDAPRFAGVWQLSTEKQSNSSGSWFNLKVDFAGWAPEVLYTVAKDTYEAVKAA